MLRFCPLFSSSSGNSVYIGSNADGILIDVGRSAKQTKIALNSIGIDEGAVRAIFLTHEHSDHVCGLSVFAARNKIPIYAANGTILSLRKSGIINEKHFENTVPESGLEVAGMFIKPFITSHDCADGRGYTINAVNGDSSVAVATDTGFVTTEMMNAITGCRLVYIESNHDVNMLKTGQYPYMLKKRILSDKGHLSNDACAEALRALVNKGTTQFVLAHLSRENNTPELAYETAVSALNEMGALKERDYFLNVASPENDREPYLV